MKHVWSIDKILKNASVLHVGTSKNLTAPLYSKTRKSEK